MRTSIPKNTICLWFNKDALDAARFYAATFPDSEVIAVHHAPGDYPSGKEGDVLTVEFTVLGIPCLGLNGGPDFKFNEAISLSIDCADQAEVDRYWTALVADGGEHSVCGWLKDRFGLSWQVVPRRLIEMYESPDRAAAERAMQAMLQMTKLDIAELERAFAGDSAAAGRRA